MKCQLYVIVDEEYFYTFAGVRYRPVVVCNLSRKVNSNRASGVYRICSRAVIPGHDILHFEVTVMTYLFSSILLTAAPGN
jgi:hypothetical protein